MRQRGLKGEGHRGQSDDKAGQVDPTRHPADGIGADVLGPLVNPARKRVMCGQFGKAERYQKLAEENGWPGPEKSRSTDCEP